MKYLNAAAISTLFVSYVYSAPLSRDPKTPEIQWTNCTEQDPPNLQCGQLKVPLDYSKPYGDQITLAVSRIKATDSANRVGSLFFNPGGPGGLTTGICIYHALGAIEYFPSDLTDRFDIICPDPRGIGGSTPVQCGPDLWNERVSAFPHDQASYDKLIQHNKALGESCLNLTGPLLYHMDTKSTAKDIEQIRLALNDGKLNWLGLSYGTQLGATYAELYPENIRAMALDGGIDHSLDAKNATTIQSSTYEDALDRFLDWCSKNSTCALYGHNESPAMIFDSLIASAEKSPIPAPGCEISGLCLPDVTAEEILFNVQGALSYKEPIVPLTAGWVGLGHALAEAVSDNATLLSTYLQRSTPDPLVFNNVYAQRAVGCLDWPAPDTDFAKQYETQQYLRKLSPRTRGTSPTYSLQAQCLGWPVNPDKTSVIPNPPHKLNEAAMKKVAPVLIVNSEHDSTTSAVWAEGLLQQIPSAKLVLRKGDGHTSFILAGEAQRVEVEYLVTGKLPLVDSVES